MKSLLRFLVFVVVVSFALGVLYLGKGFLLETRSGASGQPAQLHINAPSIQKIETSLPSLAALDREFTTLVNAVLPSVVSISAIPANAVDPRVQWLRRLLGAGGPPPSSPQQLGSGVIVSNDGHVVTNWHVIDGAGAAQIYLNDGRVFPAKFVGGDPRSDIAILQIKADGLQPISWGNSDEVQVGQMVFAVGNPLGLQETVTQGIISAKGRRALSEAANEFFQTDAAINPGNSGGPLIDLKGRIIGINNFILASGNSIGFAIPSNTVRRVYESIRDNGRFIRPWFGAIMKSLSEVQARRLGLPNMQGALILATYEGSPAETAGLVPGDVVVKFNGRTIRDHLDLRNRVAEAEIDQKVDLKIWRSGKEIELKAMITAEPD